MKELQVTEFRDLIRRIQEGDQQAALKLVQHYEPEIRRDVRLRLTDVRLRRTLDSLDICQSVFHNFFLKIALGNYNFDRPEQLLRLLSTMARNKVIDWHRQEKSRRPENNGKVHQLDALTTTEPADVQSSPSQVLRAKELLESICDRLTAEENEIAQLRKSGFSWREIAEKTSKSEDAVRKKLSRACDRVFKELGIED